MFTVYKNKNKIKTLDKNCTLWTSKHDNFVILFVH